MHIGTLAAISAVVAALLGFAAMLVPAQFLAPFGVELDDAGLFTTRLFGSHLVGLAAINWFARDDLRDTPRDRGARRAIALGNLLTPALSITIVVTALLAGTVNALAWAIVALLALLLVSWAYYGFMAPERTIPRS